MNQINQYDFQQHVSILGWLYIISHAIFLAIGAFVFVLLIGIAPVTGDPEPMWILSLVGTSVGLLMAALGLPGLLAGYGLLTRKSWARILAMVTKAAAKNSGMPRIAAKKLITATTLSSPPMAEPRLWTTIPPTAVRANAREL